ncbi:hypothetical protein L1049_000966 [Liquidambar formosana]|uniref:Disease resistance protein n=1 Tax=Liquidambar formosana TaxID=63359 RepID=A0AAP0NBJ8_LIQFO
MEYVINILSNFIAEKFNHHQSLGENMNKLKKKFEELICRKEDVKSKMQVELQAGKQPKKEVELWLANVEEINEERERIENEVKEVRFFRRASLGVHVAEKIQEVEVLLQKGIFIDGLVVDGDTPAGTEEILPTTKGAVETEKDENSECLRNDDIKRLEVHGIGGIGNTHVTNSFCHVNSINF